MKFCCEKLEEVTTITKIFGELGDPSDFVDGINLVQSLPDDHFETGNYKTLGFTYVTVSGYIEVCTDAERTISKIKISFCPFCGTNLTN